MCAYCGPTKLLTSPLPDVFAGASCAEVWPPPCDEMLPPEFTRHCRARARFALEQVAATIVCHEHRGILGRLPVQA